MRAIVLPPAPRSVLCLTRRYNLGKMRVRRDAKNTSMYNFRVTVDKR